MAKTKQNVKKDPVVLAEELGLDYIYDETRDLYILYKKESLLTDKGIHLYSHGCEARFASIAELRNTFQNMKPDEADGFVSNPANIDKERQKFLDKIDTGETIVRNLLERLPALFDYLPLTKQNKFAKNASILLYAFDIKKAYSGEYFCQGEVCLRLESIYDSILTKAGIPISVEYYDNVKILCINTYCSFQKKRPDNIVDLDGFHRVEQKRLSYLKQDMLKVGSSYIDAKGSEYLYLGYPTNDFQGTNYQSTSTLSPAYLRVRPGVLKEIEKADTLQEFIQNRVDTISKKGKQKGTYYDWWDGMNLSESKKFVSCENTYFDDDHIGYDKPVLFTSPCDNHVEIRFSSTPD